MKKPILILVIALLLSAISLSQTDAEKATLRTVKEMFQKKGNITFSELYNSDQFSPEQKQFLGRLYEIFFAIPGYLKTEFESTGRVPTRQEMGQAFGISTASVNLLLSVMEGDQRVPSLYERDPANGEITTLKIENIEAFLARRGDQVKLTGWEGKQVPSFEVQTYEGDTLASEDLKGRNSLIYFWFTGCPPCVRIAPILSDLHKEYSQQGFQVIGVNADDVLEIGTTNQERLKTHQAKGVPYINVNLNPEMRRSFGNVNVFPTLFFVDDQGVIRHHLVNFQDREKLETTIGDMLQ